MPDLILSSSSERTRQTVDLMLGCWSSEPEVVFTDDLYLATPSQMVDTIRSQHDGRETIMVLAHNPGVSTLLRFLSGQSADMPTAAVAAFEAESAKGESTDAATFWSQFSLQQSAFEDPPPQPMKLTHFMRPKALGDS